MDTELQTKKIMRNAILHYAKEFNVGTKNTQIRIYTTDNDECNGEYQILKNFQFADSFDLTLKQLMLIPKVDFRGQGMIADLFVAPKIKSILKSLSKQHNTEAINVSVIVATNDDECNDLRLILTINNKPKELIPFSSIFGD